MKRLLTALAAALSISAVNAFECQPYRFLPAASPRPAAAQPASALLAVRWHGAPTSYLFATFHSAAPEIRGRWEVMLPWLMQQSLRQALFERDLAAPVATELQRLPPEQRLEQRLASYPGLYSLAVARLSAMGVEPAQAAELKPWLVSAMLQQAPIHARQHGPILDQWLQQQTAALGLPLGYLETFADIARHHDQHLTPLQQGRLVAEAVCNEALLAELYQRQVAAYGRNDLGELMRIMSAYDGSDPALMAAMQHQLVVVRNRDFWRQLAPGFKRGGLFVAVGALHIIGEAGLAEQLTQAGAQLEALSLADYRPQLPSPRVSTLAAWVQQQPELAAAKESPYTIISQPEALLQRHLCPGSRCRVDATYRPVEREILLTHALTARLLRPSGEDPIADSLLVRELARHRLHSLAIRYAQPLPRAVEERCRRRELLHRASLLQQRYLQTVQSAAKARFFPRDGRCPALLP